MKKLLISAILLLLHCTRMLAVSAYPYPVNITQPDGSKITIILKGNEHFNFTQTTDGFIIARNIKGIYEYVDINASDEVNVSGVKANNKGERNAKETLLGVACKMQYGLSKRL